ncbi:hypothetical protein ACEPAF_5745 [Sanghuangporus sanghuang]
MITFYDIPSKLPGKAWSPNTFKTRISLKYKGVPYKTEWVEYPDIEPTLKKLSGAPTSKKDDGRDHYTLPAIHDSATGRVITDSTKIAEYLDATYPDKPLLFPPGSRASVATLEYVFMQTIAKLSPILLPESNYRLNESSEAYFRSTREQSFGKKLEELAPTGLARDAIWKEVKEGLDRLAEFYDKNGEDKLFYLADTFSFADAVVIGFLLWIKIILGVDSAEWKALASWCDGRWAKLVESTKELHVVD